MAALTDKITDAFNTANPNVATVTATRTAAATTLQCDNLAGWPTASKVHFSTYQIDTSDAVVDGTQIDWVGIVSGNNIGSLTRVAGAADAGNSIGDIVEMNPTANWAQDLADALTTEHNRDGTHSAITADSIVIADAGTLDVDTINEATTAAGVTIDGLLIKDSKLATNNSVVTSNITNASVTPSKWANPYKFRAYRSSGWTINSSSTTKVPLDAEDYDGNSNFDAATNNRYVAPVDGYYHFDATVTYSSGAGDYYGVFLYKNGSAEIAGNGHVVYFAFTTRFTVSGLIYLAATDYVELFIQNGSASNRTGTSGRTATFMSGYLVSET